jgi:hypothetical protein
MRSFFCSAALVLVASSSAHATEALWFHGGGYAIEILVGYTEQPVIGQVHFTGSGAKERVSLPRNLLRIEKFDMKKRSLLMQFSNNGDPDLPDSFSLSVKKAKAVLSISGKQITAEFNWDT